MLFQILICIGFLLYFFIKDSSGFFLINIFLIMYYFSLFYIFFIFIKKSMRNFFISLPILSIIIYISLLGFFDYDWWIPAFEVTHLILMLAPIFFLFAYIFKEKNTKKFFISLATLIITAYIGFYGLLDYIWWWSELDSLHIFLFIISLLGLLFYVFKDKYLWWLIFSPTIPMVMMYIIKEFYPHLKPVGFGMM